MAEIPRDYEAIAEHRFSVEHEYYHSGSWEETYDSLPSHLKYSPSRFIGESDKEMRYAERAPWRYWEF